MVDEVANVALTKVVPTQTTLAPYYDDFDESKNFSRILFRPGYAVQARELTQSQTILQNQIERFGSHVFKNGSIVHGGQITFGPSLGINLQSEYASTEITASDFVNKIITDETGNNTVEAYVVASKESTNTTPPTLMISYRSGDTFANGTTIRTLTDNTYAIIDNSTSYACKGMVASINEGIFFINGYFVKKPKQTIIIDPYTRSPSARIGLEFAEEIVTEQDDLTLLDPAQEASNYQAPGGARLKVTLNLVARPLDSADDENFIELLKLNNGQRVNQVQYPIYSVLGETFARRTFDESGHYTVRPFRVSVSEHPTDDTKIRLKIDPGKAYVKGYELETLGQYELDINRARTTESRNNIDITANYGNDTIVKNVVGLVDVNAMPLIDIHLIPHQNVNFSTNATYQQTKIGTARVRNIDYYSATETANGQTHKYDVSLFDLNFRNLPGTVLAQDNLTQITGINLLNSGDGYFNGNYPITITGGGGTGANAWANISGNKVASVTLYSGGEGYTGTPSAGLSSVGFGGIIQVMTITASNNGLGLTNGTRYLNISGNTTVTSANAYITVASGNITSIVIASNGVGYFDKPNVTLNETVEVEDLIIANTGRGYANGNTFLRFTGGSPTVAANAYANVVNRQINSIHFNTRGSGYTSAPTVILPGTNTTPANITAVITQVPTFDATIGYNNVTATFSITTDLVQSNVIQAEASANFSNTSNVYSGATLRFTSGAANGSGYLITGYNGTTKRFTLESPIDGTVANGDSVVVEGSFAIAESLISSVSYTPGADNDMKSNIDDANRNSLGYTYLFDTNFNSLLFKIPYDYIKEGSIIDQQYQYTKTFSSVGFAGGVGSIYVNPAREGFNGNGGSGTSTSVLDNFVIIRNDNGLPLIADTVSINATTGVASISLATAYTGTATIYAKVNLNAGPFINPKIKELIVANTSFLTSNASTGTFTSTELGSTIDVYLADGQAVIANPTGLAGARQYLHVSDITNVTAIYDLEGSAVTPGGSIENCLDVTNRYVFNNGQKDSHYDYAWIELKPKYKKPTGPIVVCFNYYDHVGGSGDDKGYFSIDSYPDINTSAGYGSIPTYINSQGIVYNLRDCIDFRPRRKNCEDLIPNYELEGIRIPVQNENFGCDIQFYLARADLLVVSHKGNTPFIHQAGDPDVRPIYPTSIEGSMPIYKINLKPYTISKDDVRLTYVENKRYTMRDIGTLEKRIENLEYYASLTLLEKTATDMVVKDGNGLDRTKNGIIVDNFMTHGIGNVFNSDYFISMDKMYGAATPPQKTIEAKMYLGDEEDIATGKRATTLDYTEVPAIIQPYATKFISVTPYARASFVGAIVMDPPADYFVETEKLPDIVQNIMGENDHTVINERINTRNIEAAVNRTVNEANANDEQDSVVTVTSDEAYFLTSGGFYQTWLGTTNR